MSWMSELSAKRDWELKLVETKKLDRVRYNEGFETDNEDEWVQDGACNDEEDECRKDSAEIDWDDPINQG